MEGNLDTVRQETHVVSVIAQHLQADARFKGEKGEQSSPAPDSKARTDSEKSFSAQEKEVLRTIEGEFRAVLDIVQTRRAMIGILPCVKITSPKRSAKMANDALFDKLRRRRIPTTSQRKVVQKDQLLH